MIVFVSLSAYLVWRCVEEHEAYEKHKCHAFVCDLASEDKAAMTLLDHVPLDSVDLCTMIFMLSAVNPDKMTTVLKHIWKVSLIRSPTPNPSLNL